MASLVALFTFAIYLLSLRNDFVSLDDFGYVVDNLHIRRLNAGFFRWAFTDLSAGFWHPLTWVSYAVDYAIWELNPFGYHLTAIIFHTLNTFLVVLLMVRLLGMLHCEAARPDSIPDYRRGVIAAGVTGLLFGLHPLHVESVAWISERKDLVCAFFFLLSLIAYLRHVASLRDDDKVRPTYFFRSGWYLLSLALFICSLASKTMAVSLPIVMLILDWYPLERVRTRKNLSVLVLEKIPFIAASLIISITSVIAQKSIGAMALMDSKPLTTRLLVAFKALAEYLWKMVMPVQLLPHYPYPRSVSLLSLEHGFPVLLFVGITAAAIVAARKEPAWLAAWGIYLVILLPALGIVQVGVHSMGDRFTYLPSLAPFLLAGVGAARMWKRPSGRVRKRAVTVGAIILVCALSYVTLKQISVWNNSLILWNYVIEKGAPFNPLAYNSRGHVYRDRGEFDKAISDYSVAIAQEPAQVEYLVSRGVAFCEKGDFASAMSDLNGAITLNPREFMSYNNRGNVWYRKGEYDRAIEDFSRAIAMKPSEYLPYLNRGAVFEKKGDLGSAVSDYTRVLAINPLLAGVYIERGDLYMKQGAMDLAARDYLEANNLGDRRRMPGAAGRRLP